MYQLRRDANHLIFIPKTLLNLDRRDIPLYQGYNHSPDHPLFLHTCIMDQHDLLFHTGPVCRRQTERMSSYWLLYQSPMIQYIRLHEQTSAIPCILTAHPIYQLLSPADIHDHQ